MASPLGFILTGVVTPLLFRFLKFLGLPAFYVSFIFIMPTLAAMSARHRAAEMVLVLHLLTILGFLLLLHLKHASTPPVTVGRVVGRQYKRLQATLPLDQGFSFICFDCPPRPFPVL